MQAKPERMCISCREMKPKSDMLRIVRTVDGKFLFDSKGKMQGRGAYICNDRNCIEKCIKTKALNRAFKLQIPDEVYAELREQYEKLQ